MVELDRDAPAFVAGHKGLVGAALVRCLESKGFSRLITKKRSELDLRDPAATLEFFKQEQPHYVFNAAARVGGIHANSSYPAEFITDNLSIAVSVIHAAHESGVKKLLNFGSSCMYPRECPQPMREDQLWTGSLEPTNIAYATAKLASLQLCDAYRAQHGRDFITLLPANAYGPGDNFDPAASHVVPAFILRMMNAIDDGAGEVTMWGTGSPLREFLYIDDLAEASLFAMENYSESGVLNVGSGSETSIRQLAEASAEACGYSGQLMWDKSKPDGMPRKGLDSSRMAQLGFVAGTSLVEGLARTVQWFKENRDTAAIRTGHAS